MFKKIRFQKRYIFLVLFIAYIIMCQSCMTMIMSKKQAKTFFDSSKTVFVDSIINFQDFKIHYIQTGNSNLPTLYFVHGSPGSWDAYKNYLTDTLLLKKYRMIALDRPGFGYSNYGKAQDLKTQSERIASFLKIMNNKKTVILVGHSMGGPVIAKMATIEPLLYNNLVFIAGSVDPNAENPEIWRTYLMKKPIRYLIPGALRPSNDELWWLKNDLIYMKPNLKKIISNVTIIHGTKDRLVPYSNMKFMQREFVNAKTLDTISIKNADHFIPWSHFEIVRNALLKLKI